MIDNWNSTLAPAFMALAFLKAITIEDAAEVSISPWEVGDPASADFCLKVALSAPNGASSLAFAIGAGLASTSASRASLVQAFEGSPKFLYDTVLPASRLDRRALLDFIRLGFDQWVVLRRLPPTEVDAIEQLWRPGLLAKILGRLPR